MNDKAASSTTSPIPPNEISPALNNSMKSSGRDGAKVRPRAVETLQPFKGRFRLFDRHTGQAVPERSVRIFSSAGHRVSELTDSEGYTTWVTHDQSHVLQIELTYEDSV